MRYLWALVLTVGILVTGCDSLSKDSSKSTSPAPAAALTQGDQVVGVLLKCEWLVAAGAGSFRTAEDSGEACNKPATSGGFTTSNRHLLITVRTPSGTTYQAQMPPDTNVRVGDPWPVR